MKKAITIYDTRTGATGAIAQLIEEELKAEEEGYDLVGAIKNVDAVIVGSPTYYNDLFSPVKNFLLEMEKADLKGKIGAAFGSYGSSSEAVKMITDTMKNAFKMNVIKPGLKVEGRPNGSTIAECRVFGKTVAERINRDISEIGSS